MPRAKSTHQLRASLAQVAVAPSPDLITATAQLLADHVASRPQPDMAVGALFRHNAPSLSPDLKQTIREEALAIIRARSAAAERQCLASHVEEDGGWLVVHEAAPRLRLQERTLLERLKQWQYRRMYGWPRWDGHRWLMPALAADSSRAAAFLASQPARDPLEDLLPEWCERQP